MPDYGLTLPDHDLTPQDFKELARRLGRAAFVPLFLKFYERIVTGEATIEEQRKALADIGRWTGVEEDRKVDPNANLPVFNIIFGQPGTPTLAAEVVMDASAQTPNPPMPRVPLDPNMTPEEAAGILASADKLFAEFPLLEDDNAQPSPRSSTYRALADLAATVQPANPAGEPAEPAGSGAPDTPDVQRPAKQGRARLRSPPPVPAAVPVLEPPTGQALGQVVLTEDVARNHDTLEDALRTLDSALDGF